MTDALSVDLVIQTLANDSIPTIFWLYNEMKFIIMLDCTCCKKMEQTRNKYTVPVKYFVWDAICIDLNVSGEAVSEEENVVYRSI